MSQIVGSDKNYDQNGDRMSKYDKSGQICSIRLKRLLGRNGNIGIKKYFAVPEFAKSYLLLDIRLFVLARLIQQMTAKFTFLQYIKN